MDVTLPDGTVIQGVPDGTTKADLAARLKSNGYDVTKLESPSLGSKAAQAVGDTVAGALRGAGSIGATLLSPVDWSARKMNGGQPVNIGGIDIVGQDRRAGMDSALQDMGADTNSLAFKGSKLVTEVAGTLGAGGAAANALVRVAPRFAAAAPGVIEAMRTAGMSAPSGNMLARATGGAISGGISAGLVDPSEAGAGAVVGGAAPPLLKGAGLLGQAIGNGVGKLAKNALGLSTGAGGEAVAQAFKAGQTGNADFVANMRGNVPLTDVLDRAKQGIANMQAAKSAEYKAGMIPIKGDQTILSMGGIDKALQDAADMTMYKGQVKNETASAAVDKMRAIVDEWKALDPVQFHTPEGLDALKQKLGGVLEGINPQERAARLAAGKVYDAAKSEIQAQAPEYAKVMKNYSEASDLIKEIERALSAGQKASADTGMRKLQSLMRNNVNTNYGNRLDLAKQLESQGGVDILPSVAGQALNSATPRGLSGLGAQGMAAGSLYFHNPLMAAALPLQSPRAVGEMAYGLGRATSAAGRGVNALQQGVLAGNPRLNALADPATLAQFGYRAAPAITVGR